MFSLSLRWTVLSAAATAIVCLSAASAQARMPAKESASNAAPALQYQSALANYRKFDDQPVSPWTQINETVGKIGGWRVYAKEAREPDPVATKKTLPNSATDQVSEPARTMPEPSMNHGAKP